MDDLPLPPDYIETFNFIMEHYFEIDEVAHHLIEQHDKVGAFEIIAYAIWFFEQKRDVEMVTYWTKIRECMKRRVK